MSGEEQQGSVAEVESPASTEGAAAEPTAPAQPEKPSYDSGWVFQEEQEPVKPTPEPAKPAPAPEPKAPEWNPPVFDPDLFARDGNTYMSWYQRQWLGPVAQAQLQHQREVAELRQQLGQPQIHPAIVNQQFRRAQDGLTAALDRFSHDEAFASVKLRKNVEDYYKGVATQGTERQ